MMAAGNPNWWSMHQTSSDLPQPFLHLLNNHFNLHAASSSSSSSSSSSPSLPFSPLIADHTVPQSWSQLLLNGMASNNEEERMGASNHFHQINHVMSPSSPPPLSSNHVHESMFTINPQQQQQQQQQETLIKQERAYDPRSSLYGHGHSTYNQQSPVSWSHISPKSSVTTLSNSNGNNNNNNNNNNKLLNLSSNWFKGRDEKNEVVEQSSECKRGSVSRGVGKKKARVEAASTAPLKVRKEKLGDRITALHQIVSPFGKTDTASVLLEAIGYIRFLQAQVEALCSPYLPINHHSADGERNGLFPEHPGQDGCAKDLRSRGLCLVPSSCTQLVASDNTADYWAPSLCPPGF